jgi:hypothetical protein
VVVVVEEVFVGVGTEVVVVVEGKEEVFVVVEEDEEGIKLLVFNRGLLHSSMCSPRQLKQTKHEQL